MSIIVIVELLVKRDHLDQVSPVHLATASNPQHRGQQGRHRPPRSGRPDQHHPDRDMGQPETIRNLQFLAYKTGRSGNPCQTAPIPAKTPIYGAFDVVISNNTSGKPACL